MSSLAKPFQYYQVFLSQGLGLGLGLGLILTPTVGISSHHFLRRRALATGVALSGPAIGGIIYPISEQPTFYSDAFMTLCLFSVEVRYYVISSSPPCAEILI